MTTPTTSTDLAVAGLAVIPWDGKQITKPGIYSGIPMSKYHSPDICDGPSLSSTILRKSEKLSLDEVWDVFPGNPDRDESDDDKEAFIKGRARHTLFLGESGFREQFLVRPEDAPDGKGKWHGNNNSCKKWLADAKLDGKSVLKPDELPNIHGAAKKLTSHPAIAAGLLSGLVEHSIFWKDPKTGVWLKVRPDVLPIHCAMIVDYKGAAAVQRQDCKKAINEHGYYMQLALVAEGLFQVAGAVIKDDDHILVFQKWTRPFTINVKPLTTEAINRGHQQNRRAIDRIAACLASGIWPGPEDDMVAEGLQDYLSKRLADEEKFGLLPGLDELVSSRAA